MYSNALTKFSENFKCHNNIISLMIRCFLYPIKILNQNQLRNQIQIKTIFPSILHKFKKNPIYLVLVKDGDGVILINIQGKY